MKMSLLNGMDKMFDNPAATEAAERDLMFRDESAMEASECVDCLVYGIPDDYNEIYDDDDYDEAIEAAALTGQDFLNSLNLSQGDPIEGQRRMHGSLGPSSSAANFPTNFHDDFPDDNDPSAAYSGSLGPSDSTANFPENFHDEFEDDNDPIRPIPGSVGPESSTPRDPAMEATAALGFLMTDDDCDFEDYIAQEGLKSWNKARKEKKYDKACKLIGVPSLDMAEIDRYCEDGMWNKAEQRVQDAIKHVEARRKALVYGDPDSKKKAKAAKKMMDTYNGLLVHISIGKNSSELEKQGYDKKTAHKAAVSKAKEMKRRIKDAENLSPSTEAAMNLVFNFYHDLEEAEAAMEAFEDAGSVGQRDSYANFSGNYSDGNDDSSATYKDTPPGSGSAASFETNFGGGFLDNADPIIAGDSSIGQEDSTARDPATESYQDILDELDNLEAELLAN